MLVTWSQWKKNRSKKEKYKSERKKEKKKETKKQKREKNKSNKVIPNYTKKVKIKLPELRSIL